mmetsp:Transcript_56027/g.167729  ORF Transcript_56027/g.167729 Transcript_56027/m.167729 type:complete len:318 (-) Transcript_56027:136-1089(-)
MVLASSLLVCQVDTPCSCTPIAHARLQSVPGLCIDIHDHLIYLACAVEMLMPCPLQIYQNLVLSCFCGQQYQRTEYRINCKICTEPQEPADCSSEQTCGWLCPLSVGIVTLNAHYIRTFGNLPVFLKKKKVLFALFVSVVTLFAILLPSSMLLRRIVPLFNLSPIQRLSACFMLRFFHRSPLAFKQPLVFASVTVQRRPDRVLRTRRLEVTPRLQVVAVSPRKPSLPLSLHRTPRSKVVPDAENGHKSREKTNKCNCHDDFHDGPAARPHLGKARGKCVPVGDFCQCRPNRPMESRRGIWAHSEPVEIYELDGYLCS